MTVKKEVKGTPGATAQKAEDKKGSTTKAAIKPKQEPKKVIPLDPMAQFEAQKEIFEKQKSMHSSIKTLDKHTFKINEHKEDLDKERAAGKSDCKITLYGTNSGYSDGYEIKNNALQLEIIELLKTRFSEKIKDTKTELLSMQNG